MSELPNQQKHEDVPRALRRRRGSRLLRIALRSIGFAVVAAVGLAGAAAVWALYQFPVGDNAVRALPPAVFLEAADGEALGRRGAIREIAVRSDFPDILVNSVIAIEDRRFYDHPGIDLRAIARAALRNLSAGRYVEGASTITQQLVRLQVNDDARTMARKMREAIRALWLETWLDKDEILTRYLNNVYMGAGVYGMAAAAQVYFDKEVGDLSLMEASTLAGIIRAPSTLNPRVNPEAAHARAIEVIDALLESGAISKESANKAKSNPVRVRARHPVGASSWFTDWAAGEAAKLGRNFKGTTHVRTTLRPDIQRIAASVVREMLGSAGAEHNVSQAALVAIRRDGAVVAMVGGLDYGESQFNRAVQAKRQPGSAFKLFVYLAALRSGYGLDDVVEDAPIEVDGWSPDNYGERYHGPVTLREAFARSLNSVAVRLALASGLDEVVDAARDLGIDAPLPEHPSLALGAIEVNLLDLTAAYASILADRAPLEPRAVLAIGAADQPQMFSVDVPSPPGGEFGRYREPLIRLLESVIHEGTGHRAALDGFAAGKTGTSQNYRDAWFIGFNDALTVGVWVGNDDASPMNKVTGGTLPAEIWRRFITQATPLLDGEPLVDDDDGMAMVEVTPGAEEEFAVNVPEEVSGSLEPDGEPLNCDFSACSRAYDSFRRSDCTYQPYQGPRRHCVRSDRTADAGGARPALGDSPREAPFGAGQCNFEACASTYRSFEPSDCSYQPYDSPQRRQCVL